MVISFDGFRHCFNFKTRASRTEFWSLMLCVWLLIFIASSLDEYFFKSYVVLHDGTRWGKALLLCLMLLVVPYISVSIRRLHDIGFAGWWFLLSFIPIIGNIIFFLVCLKKGSSTVNRFGEPINQPDENNQEVA